MASNIDPTKPETGLAYTADVRANFQAAKEEIEALQGGTGHDPVTVADSTSIDFTITGQQISAAAVFGTEAGTVAQGNDSRLSNTRTPTAHAASHKNGGSDEIVATISIQSGNYTIQSIDSVVVFIATATAMLPAATGSGRTYRIICRAGTLTIDPAGSETVKGETSAMLSAGEDLIITDTETGVWE